MIKNKTLGLIALTLLPVALISFAYKKDETNFNLNEKIVEESTNEEEKPAVRPKIKVLVENTIEELDLEDYIVGVVAGEMPASFQEEALKAQAVASRTYAIYKKTLNKDGEYDLTDDTNTQVYLTREAMEKKWGDDYQKYYSKIKRAVEETKSEIITYKGDPIEAFYFAMSAGATNDSASVFKEDRDYLKTVTSIYDTGELNGYEVAVNIPKTEFLQKLNLTCKNPQIEKKEANDIGYVQNITICGKEFEGTRFRTLLGLRSTNFTIEIKAEIVITTKGYGHGVGMSQYGANGYAENGYSYIDILKHYYTGVEISNLKNV